MPPNTITQRCESISAFDSPWNFLGGAACVMPGLLANTRAAV